MNFFFERVLETLRFSMVFTQLLGIIVTLIGLFLSDPLILLFSGDQNMSYREIAGEAMGLYFLLFLAAGQNYFLAAFLQSTGKTPPALFVNLLKGFLLVAPALMILPNYFGLSGIWLSRSLAEILTLLLFAAYMMYHK